MRQSEVCEGGMQPHAWDLVLHRMGMHGGEWGRLSKPRKAYMYCTQRGRDGCPCPLLQPCMAMHGEHMEAQPPMGLKGDSCVIISGSEQGQGTHVKEA